MNHLQRIILVIAGAFNLYVGHKGYAAGDTLISLVSTITGIGLTWFALLAAGGWINFRDRALYKIESELIGGEMRYCIYKRKMFGYDFYERWNTPESVAVRMGELHNELQAEYPDGPCKHQDRS